MVEDITHRRESEKQARQAHKMESIGRLAGGVAHDFNNLLTVINGYSSMLLYQLKEEDPIRDRVNEIGKAGQLAAGLTKQLLAFSRQAAFVLEPLDLSEVVVESASLLRRMVREDVEIITRLAPKAGPVMADSGQIHQVLMNLVANAGDAMPQGGKLVIETQIQSKNGAEHVLLSVADNGQGMSADVRQKIFDPFYTTKGKGRGTGLGLSTVYGIVQTAGGWIQVESEEGRGTLFLIGLPLSQTPVAAVQVAAAAQSELPRGTETVLVVEDHEDVREFVINTLAGYGYRTVEARSGNEALALLKDERVSLDLLVTDLVMPGKTGKEIAERARATRPSLRVLYMSGYSDDLQMEKNAPGAGTGFIQKPFSGEELATRIRSLLERS